MSYLQCFLLSCCCLFSVNSLAQTCNDRDCINIGTFNIEWLGTPMRSNNKVLRTRSDIRAIVDIISQEADLDIVVLQEINATDNPSFRFLEQQLQAEGYNLFVGSSGRQQQQALAWRSQHIRVLSPPIELDVKNNFSFKSGNTPCRSFNLRKPLAAHFQAGQFNFWLVGVHLKSPRYKPECSRFIQTQQLNELIKQLQSPAFSTPSEDIIILGDFNLNLDSPTLNSFQQQYPPLLKTQKRHKESASYSFLKGRGGISPDHIFAHNNTLADWVPLSSHILKATQTHCQSQHQNHCRRYSDYLSQISDHAPVWASFYTYPPQNNPPQINP